MYTATVAQIREMEKNAVASGVPEYELMCRAGYQAAVWIEKLFPQAARLVFLCGGGNNGGRIFIAYIVLHDEHGAYSALFAPHDGG